MAKDDFFIGWQEKLPPTNINSLKIFVLLVFITIPVLSILIVVNQKKFRDHTFQLGKITTIEGNYYNVPVPMFVVDDPSWDPNLSKNILLVGYGKTGAEGIMKKISHKMGDLDGKKLKIQGTLIYGDKKTLLELTEKENTVINIINDESSISTISESSPIELSGEIIDPKCYFGVMKPGEGKVHKSCAIRCISGGIPPVFKVKNNGSLSYYLILGPGGEKINKDLLHYVAEQTALKGLTYEHNGWNIIEVSTESIRLL